jgi:hypothetical protein
LFVLAATLCAPPHLFAQASSPVERNDPRAEVFGGYSGYRAGGKVNGVTVPDFTTGWSSQFIVNTTHWVGIVLDVNGHYNSFATAHDFAVGVRFQRPLWRFVPFAEGLMGLQRFSPKGQPSQNAPTYVGGGGLDIKITPQFSVRPFQISYVNTLYDANSASTNLDRNYFNGIRAQAGLIYNLRVPSGASDARAVCSAEPAEVDAGEPINISVVARGFQPKRTLSFSYSSTGGNVVGKNDVASVDTSGVTAGSYTVVAKVVDNGKGKHQQTAGCEATFKVKQKLPPALSVSADPGSLFPGDSSKITARGSSPDQRPLSYTCSTNGGHLAGSGPSYTLDTAGVSEGKIVVTCTVSDDRSLSASASASIDVTVPKGEAPPPVKFGTIEFMHDSRRPSRVDNQAKGELDRFADALAASPDAKGVVVGYASAAENKESALLNVAPLRSVNTKDYLVKDKGIDPVRIEPRTGSGDGQKVELWMVPADSGFVSEGTKVVDEKQVKAIPRVALKVKAHRKRKHKHKAS